MQLTVKAVHDAINAFAPFETAEAYDNVGLLVGDWDAPVRRVLCTLDITMATVEEAERLQAELIVSHHPLMFHGVKRLIRHEPEADLLSALIMRDLNVIAAHTNWDQTVYSGSASVAQDLGIINLRQAGYLFTGEFPEALSAADVLRRINTAIHAPARVYGPMDRAITTMSFGGGAYGEGYLQAFESGAQAYLTGEIRHHEIIDAVARGLTVFDVGHYASEAPMIPRLISYLKSALPDARDVTYYCSTQPPFDGALLV